MFRRPIVAPLNWPLDEWQALPEKEQIHWWLENGWRIQQERFPSEETRRKLLRKSLRFYQRGIYTQHELFNDICSVLDERCLREILQQIPEEVLELLKGTSNSGPALDDEDAWGTQEIIYAGVVFAHNMTEDDYERMVWQDRSASRELRRILQRVFSTKS